MKPEHQKNVRKHLKRWKSITSWGAIQKYGCTRLAAVIDRLKDEGMKIKSVTMHTPHGTIYSKYVLK